MREEEVEGPTITSGMRAIHYVITRGISVALDSARLYSRDEHAFDEMNEGYADYAHTLSSVLNAHHLAEDEVAFPFLATLLPDAQFDTLSAAHRVMEPLILWLDVAGDMLRSGEVDVLNEMSHVLVNLDDMWHPHIELEEESFSDENLRDLMTSRDNAEILQKTGEHNQKNAGPDYLVLPFLLYNLEPPERARFARQLPSMIVDKLVPVDWKDKWSRMRPFLLE